MPRMEITSLRKASVHDIDSRIQLFAVTGRATTRNFYLILFHGSCEARPFSLQLVLLLAVSVALWCHIPTTASSPDKEKFSARVEWLPMTRDNTYLSDGLETVRYCGRENFTILVTAGSYPEVSGYTVSMEPCGCLLQNPLIWRLIGNTTMILSKPKVFLPVQQRLKLLVVLE